MFFQSPSYLYLLLGIIPLLGIFIWGMIKKRNEERKFADKELLEVLKPDSSPKRAIWRFFFIILAFASLVIAIARPSIRINSSNKTNENRGIELMICLDISNSMRSQDIKPSRLDFAKNLINRLFIKMAGNKIGLIVFGGDAFTYIPITTDLSTASSLLDGVSPDMISAQGTDISKAIRLANRSFSPNKEIGKAILIITDGEDHQENAVNTAKEAAKLGIKVYTVGIGSHGGGVIPMGDGSYLKDSQGNIVMTRFNKQMCEEIASEGKGIFVSGTNLNSISASLENAFKTLPHSSIMGGDAASYQELYRIFVFIALLSLLVEIFIFERMSNFFRKYKLF